MGRQKAPVSTQPLFKISITNKKLKPHNFQCISNSVSCFKSDKLTNTKLPKRSEKLNKLLSEYSKEMQLWSPRERQKMRKKSSKTVLNGFTAFRSFYSKFAKDYSKQIELSHRLTEIWREEVEIHDTWDRIALNYRQETQNLSFSAWMYYKEKGESEQNENEDSKGKVVPRVEDIFIDRKKKSYC